MPDAIDSICVERGVPLFSPSASSQLSRSKSCLTSRGMRHDVFEAYRLSIRPRPRPPVMNGSDGWITLSRTVDGWLGRVAYIELPLKDPTEEYPGMLYSVSADLYRECGVGSSLPRNLEWNWIKIQ